MLIQFDREDSENLVLTFNNSDDDTEQMKDFIDWLDASGLEYNKLKMKIPGVADKVTNVFVKKPQTKKVTNQVAQEQQTTKVTNQVAQEPQTTSIPTKTTSAKSVPVPVLLEEESDTEEKVNVVDESSSDSESEDEPISRTKKTTKRVANSRK